MKTITKQKAQEIASDWHGGQNSALYSFASTGEFHIPYALQYFKEIWADIEPEYWHAREVNRSEREKKSLHSLKNFLLLQAKANGLEVEFHPSEKYGYQIPFLGENVPDSLAMQVNPLKYLA